MDRELLDIADDRAEALLYQAYDHVAPVLDATFEHLGELADEELGTLVSLAQELGLDVDREEMRRSEPGEDVIVWRPVARASVLELLDTASREAVWQPNGFEIAPLELAKHCFEQLDLKSFHFVTALSESDAFAALSACAEALVRWEVLQEPQVLSYNDSYLTIVAGREPDVISALVHDTPPVLLRVDDSIDDLDWPTGEGTLSFGDEAVEAVEVTTLVGGSDLSSLLRADRAEPEAGYGQSLPPAAALAASADAHIIFDEDSIRQWRAGPDMGATGTQLHLKLGEDVQWHPLPDAFGQGIVLDRDTGEHRLRW